MSEDRADLDDWADRLHDAFEVSVGDHSNETELREHVHALILDAVADLYGMSHQTSSGEKNTKAKGRSPADRLYGGVVVEWEWNMSTPKKREHGAEQAVTYMENLRSLQGIGGDVFTAVVCDGRRWGFLHFDPDATDPNLLSEEPPASFALRFTWRENSPAACRQFLQLIGSHRKVPITGRALTQHFGPGSDVAQTLVTVLSSVVAGRIPDQRTDTLHKEWSRALEVVYGSLDTVDGELAETVKWAYKLAKTGPLGDSLFVLHTYFALVSRILAVELLALAVGEPDDAPTSWSSLADDELIDRLRGLEQGELPGELEITNLFEADLFSWWADEAKHNLSLLRALRELLSAVDSFAFPRLVHGPQRAGDVLRDLYQSLVPNRLRKALGEFLTPHWLAEACRERLTLVGAPLQTGRILDPTCGTGTFIVPVLASRLAALRHRSDTATLEEVQQTLDSVTGIDLNPVAVTATRVNYVLALGDLTNLGPLTLPVWRADSILVPEMSSAQSKLGDIAGITHTELKTSLSEPFTIPRSLDSAPQIATLRAILEASVHDMGPETSDDDVDAERLRFEDAFRDEFGPGAPRELLPEFVLDDELAVASNLFAQVAALAREGRNGVWGRLIENAFAPRFAGLFDVVLGNPPWLAFGKFPDEWRKQSESVWRSAGLWQPPAGGKRTYAFQDTDVAALVFAVCLMRYTKPSAFVGLLVPNNLIHGVTAGQAFRQFHLKPASNDPVRATGSLVSVPFRPKYVDDWSRVQPFAPDAANTPIFLIAQRDQAAQFPVAATRWSRAEVGARTAGVDHWHGGDGMRALLTGRAGSFQPITGGTSAWSFQAEGAPELIPAAGNGYTFGKGLDTRGANGVFFVRLNRKITTSGKSKARVRIVNDPSAGRTQGISATVGDVEADLIYPVLRGRDVTAWKAKPTGFFVLPHEPENLGRPLPSSRLRREYPKADSWLRKHRTVLQARKTPPSRKWNMSSTGDDWYRVDGPVQHMAGGFSVVFREITTEPQAAFVEPEHSYDLVREVSPLIDHKLSFLTVGTREEALYITAMLNSTPMTDLFKSFVSGTSVSPTALAAAPIPAYDPSSADMVALAEHAAAIVATSYDDRDDEADSRRKDMDRLVLSIVKAAPTYRPQPAPTPRRRKGTSKAVQADHLF